MGTLWSSLKESEDLQGTPGSLNLTKKEFSALQANWKIVRSKAADSGMTFFEELFKLHPEYQKLFKPFAGVPLEALRQSTKFQAHAITVMYALSSFVDSVEDLECLREMIYNTVDNHGKRGVTIVHFKDFMDIFMSVLQERWKNEMTPTTLNAWTKTNRVVLQYFEEAFHDLNRAVS